jgi:hypothetical protein
MISAKQLAQALTLAASGIALLPAIGSATPSSTYWAPSVGTCQGYLVPHVTYDTYFAKSGAYPIDTGLTMGVSPSSRVQAEIGYDLFLPTGNPVGFYLNGKVCAVAGSFSVGGGVYNMGFHDNSTAYHTLYAVAQKTLPFGGYVSGGFYYGLGSENLYTNEKGDVARTGAIVGWASPDIKVGLKGLSKILFVGDVQTGKNALGAGGVGVNLYFNDYIGLITGPVWYFDKHLQPGGSSWLWTAQIDIDIPIKR